jgi:hypothetical protein
MAGVIVYQLLHIATLPENQIILVVLEVGRSWARFMRVRKNWLPAPATTFVITRFNARSKNPARFIPCGVFAFWKALHVLKSSYC